MSSPVDLYDNVYGNCETDAEAASCGTDRAGGETNFTGLQRFLDCVEQLLSERRLSRFAYLAEKRGP